MQQAHELSRLASNRASDVIRRNFDAEPGRFMERSAFAQMLRNARVARVLALAQAYHDDFIVIANGAESCHC
jgi:hypothetical protein